MSRRIESEEQLISRYLAPLARGAAGAFGLLDDCAVVDVPAGQEIVVTVDAVAEGVHFLPGAAPEDVAWKALAVNVSDLAAKAARPVGYLMALSFPSSPDHDWMERFTAGLAEAQNRFSIVLLGGDTDRRPGPLSVTITALGAVAKGMFVRRGTATPGDRLFVSGTIGDGALGLELARRPALEGEYGLTSGEAAHLLGRYRRPEPRVDLADALGRCASAAMDVSDGLVKDLTRMLAAAGCGAEISASRVPLSDAARKVLAAQPEHVTSILTGGDDYEILATVPENRAVELVRRAASAGVAMTEIGIITAGRGVRAADIPEALLSGGGWDHFRAPEGRS